jgi:ParB family chromosome partitioning protein
MVTQIKTAQNNENYIEKEILYVSPEEIMPNTSQPRTFFDSEGLNELAESIAKYGILQPLTVRKVENISQYAHFKYELIAGERRLRAAKLLNMDKVPCILRESDTKTSAELAIIENLHRKDLNVFEEAAAIASLIEIHHLTQEQVASKLSMTQAGVANKLRLLRLTEEEKRLIIANNLTERHARALLRLKLPSERITILHKIITNNLNVKQTETYIERKLPQNTVNSGKKRAKQVDATCPPFHRSLISAIESTIEHSRANGVRVKTQQTETDTEIIFTLSVAK